MYTQNHESQNMSLTNSLILLTQRGCQLDQMAFLLVPHTWRLFHTFYELKMGKSTHIACFFILVGRIHCKLSAKTIPGGAVGLCTCLANQKVGFGSHDHSVRSRHHYKLRSPQWQTVK